MSKSTDNKRAGDIIHNILTASVDELKWLIEFYSKWADKKLEKHENIVGQQEKMAHNQGKSDIEREQYILGRVLRLARALKEWPEETDLDYWLREFAPVQN